MNLSIRTLNEILKFNEFGYDDNDPSRNRTGMACTDKTKSRENQGDEKFSLRIEKDFRFFTLLKELHCSQRNKYGYNSAHKLDFVIFVLNA